MSEENDKVDEIIDRAIRFTETVLDRAPEMAAVAFDALSKMRVTLSDTLPTHPALEKLGAYLDQCKAMSDRKKEP